MTDDLTPIPFPDPPPDPTGRAAFWRGAADDFASSGLSFRAFCLSRGLTERTFYTWRTSRPRKFSDAPKGSHRPPRTDDQWTDSRPVRGS